MISSSNNILSQLNGSSITLTNNNNSTNKNNTKKRKPKTITLTRKKKRRINNKTSWFESETIDISDTQYSTPDNKIILFISSNKPEYIYNPYSRVLEYEDWKRWNTEHDADKNGRAIKSNNTSNHIKYDDNGYPILQSPKNANDSNNPQIIPIFPFMGPNNDNRPSFFDFILTTLTEDIENKKNMETKKDKKDKETKKDSSDNSNNTKCNNRMCNHKTSEEDSSLPFKINVTTINDLDDLIILGKAYHCKKQTTYRCLNLRLLNNLVPALLELKDMVGMKDVKKRIVDQILFFLQGFNTVDKCGKCYECSYDMPCIQTNTDMLHTVITGPPGVGKTCLARILGKVYTAMGLLSNGEFHEVARSDFVAKYLGQTAIKTKELIEKCKGGIMFIDEAYALGHKNKRDSFAKEALDTLNKYLSDEKDLLCIIAGYKKELDQCFFAMNDGLKRRFTFRYDIDTYDYKELLEIFKLKVEQKGWGFDSDDDKTNDNNLINMFRKSKEYFPYSGGDIETLFLQCKITHGRRMPKENKKKQLTLDDIEKGFDEFVKHRKYKEKTKKNTEDGLYEESVMPSMYTRL